MRIGVAIPCYKYHLPLLKRCLDSIERQTRKPDEVVVACSSSVKSDIPAYSYSFPLRIVTRETRHNAASNRNDAVKYLTTDIVSFFDADDVMHPQRLEAIEASFPCDIVLHSYVEASEPQPMYETIPRLRNKLGRSPTGCAVIWEDYCAPIHHAHVSVARSVLDSVSFREGPDGYMKEDALFCGDVLARPGCQSVYISIPLSIYYQTGYTIDDEYFKK